MIVSFDDEPIQDFEDHLEEEDDPEIDQIEEEYSVKEKMVDAVGEQQEDQEVDEVEPGTSNSNFDLSEEPEDESDLNYNPSRDHQDVSGVDLSRSNFEPHMYISMFGMDRCVLCSI